MNTPETLLPTISQITRLDRLISEHTSEIINLCNREEKLKCRIAQMHRSRLQLTSGYPDNQLNNEITEMGKQMAKIRESLVKTNRKLGKIKFLRNCKLNRLSPRQLISYKHRKTRPFTDIPYFNWDAIMKFAN
jgi:hypothetical protein